jgi:hypothetical protein
MSASVYKYELGPDRGGFRVHMPEKAQILHVDTQVGDNGHEGIFLWALVDTCSRVTAVPRVFHVAGTGRDLHALGYSPSTWHYVGSAAFRTARLVFHVFEDTENYSW